MLPKIQAVMLTNTQNLPLTYMPTAVCSGSVVEPVAVTDHASLTGTMRYGSISCSAQAHLAHKPYFNKPYSFTTPPLLGNNPLIPASARHPVRLFVLFTSAKPLLS